MHDAESPIGQQVACGPLPRIETAAVSDHFRLALAVHPE